MTNIIYINDRLNWNNLSTLALCFKNNFLSVTNYQLFHDRIAQSIINIVMIN